MPPRTPNQIATAGRIYHAENGYDLITKVIATTIKAQIEGTTIFRISNIFY